MEGLRGCASTGHDDELEIEAASDPVLVIDAQGRICDANHLAELLFGAPREELVDSDFDAWIGCDGINASSLCEVQSVRFIGAARRLFAKHRCGGAPAHVELTICALPDGVRVVVVRPLTARPRDTLREDEMAEIVHDLKSPLSTIALEAHLLNQRAMGPRGHTQRIERNIAYMDRLVHELLDLCAIDAGKLQIERRPAELRELIEHVLDRAPDPDRERVFIEAKGPVVVACDEPRIERVIANFVENALKYSPKRSRVLVRLAVGESSVNISVIDQGPGLSAEEAAGVFEKFKRGIASRGRSGSGLGLFVCRKIIEAHGGIVGVESVEGAGSRFYFELPLPRRPVVERPRTRCGGLVLIVDDDRERADGLAQILLEEGYATAIAASALEAAVIARTHHPDLVITEAWLRGTSGVDLLFGLRDEVGTIPSILLTGLPPEDPSVDAAIHRLRCACVARPVNILHLVEVVRAMSAHRDGWK